MSINIKLPKILRGKLEFGNRAQINALRQYEIQIDQQNQHADLQAKGQLKFYEVEFELKGRWTRNVWAENKEKAENIANELFDGYDVDDMEINYVNVYERKPSVHCICITKDGSKPWNWDNCPVHGNTVFKDG